MRLHPLVNAIQLGPEALHVVSNIVVQALDICTILAEGVQDDLLQPAVRSHRIKLLQPGLAYLVFKPPFVRSLLVD